MRPYPYMPGVPAAGHISSSGYWHPGPVDGCPKCATPTQRRRHAWETPDDEQRATFQPSDGRTYGPDGLLITAGCTGFGG